MTTISMTKTRANTNPGPIEAVGEITGGVDTHLEFHVAAARDRPGRNLGTHRFPATRAGYGALHTWLSGFGPLGCVGIEGTGSYGAGLSTHLTDLGVVVVEVNRPQPAETTPHRQVRSRRRDRRRSRYPVR
jgi:transposase